jgi:molybdopterin converting factor small subunit
MEIEVRLFATMQVYRPGWATEHVFRLRLTDSAAVDSALAALSVPREAPRILVLNGKRVREDCPLRDGDVLSVFPVLGGG